MDSRVAPEPTQYVAQWLRLDNATHQTADWDDVLQGGEDARAFGATAGGRQLHSRGALRRGRTCQLGGTCSRAIRSGSRRLEAHRL